MKAIYVCINERFVPLFHVFMHAFRKNACYDLDFYCFVDDKKIIDELKYEYPDVMFRLSTHTQIDNYTHWDDSFFYGMSIKVFALEQLKSKYKRLLYMDVDTIVTGDINELLDLDMQGHTLAGVSDFSLDRRGLTPDDYPETLNQIFNEYIECAGSVTGYINSGVVLIDCEKYEPAITYDEFATKYEPVCVDQNYWNFVCKGSVLLIPERYNYMVDHLNSESMQWKDRLDDAVSMSKALVQHFHGQAKPWNLDLSDRYISQMYSRDWLSSYRGIDWMRSGVDQNRKKLERINTWVNAIRNNHAIQNTKN